MASSQESIEVSDDEVIRRKLLMDGEGMGDDRRITVFMQKFFEWSDAKGQTEEQVIAGYENLLTTLGACEFSMKKSHEAQAANKRELQKYGQIESEIEKNIEDVKETISSKKAELKNAKKIRAQKQERDALARVVAERPDRKEMEAKLLALNEEIVKLAKEKQKLQTKFQTRHKDLDVLLSATHAIKEELKAMESSEKDPTL